MQSRVEQHVAQKLRSHSGTLDAQGDELELVTPKTV